MQWAGLGAGATDALQQVLAQRHAQIMQAERLRLQQEADARQAEQFAQNLTFQRERAAVGDMQMAADNADRTQQRERQATQDRLTQSERQNTLGKKLMIGDFLTQRDRSKPLTDVERGTLETMAVTDDIALPDSLMAKPQRRVVTTIGPRGGPIQKLVSEEELEAGVPEYREPKQGPAPDYVTLVDAQGNQRQAQKGQESNALMAQGWKLYDAAAARSSQPVNPQEALDTAREVQRIARALRTHPGFNRAFGVLDSQLPTFSQDTANAEELLKSLTDLLTLENMGKMKGVLSDRDIQVLRQASTTLGGGRIGEAAAAEELRRLDEAMGAVTGDRGSTVVGNGPRVGEQRMINGVLAQWDGRGWLPVVGPGER